MSRRNEVVTTFRSYKLLLQITLGELALSLSSLQTIEAILLAFSNCLPLSSSWKRDTNLTPKFSGQKSHHVNAICDLKDTSCPIQVFAASCLLLQIASCVRALTKSLSKGFQSIFKGYRFAGTRRLLSSFMFLPAMRIKKTTLIVSSHSRTFEFNVSALYT